MNVAVVGLGLIGGSMAIDLKKSGFASKLVGIDLEESHVQQALDLKIIDEAGSLESAVEACDLIILAVPVQHIVELLPKVLDQVSTQVVIDVGSTKQVIADLVRAHPNRQRYVATHPMAGTEFSGPQAAITGLFKNKVSIICDVEDCAIEAVKLVNDLYEHLDMPTMSMSAQDHDLHAAYVSHISHISSFALALTVLKKEKQQYNIFSLASGGFDSTVRLAKSSKEMWTPILNQNAKNVLSVLETYMGELDRFRKAIESGDLVTLDALITDANKIRKVL